MSTLKPSGFEPRDWAAPWRVEHPGKKRPPLGPERDAWLEQLLLFRSSRELAETLDRIDPAIARNEAIAQLDEDTVTLALLEFLKPESAESEDSSSKKRIPLHRARVFLRYFVRGFREYCHHHGLRQPRLPLIREFSLDEGFLRAETFETLRQWRRCVNSLLNAIGKNVFAPSVTTPPPEQIAALFICSSALLGGLARHAHWEALVAKLGSPPQRTGDLFCYRFDQRPAYRWLADPVTEALLRRFWHRGLIPLPEGTKLSPRLVKEILGLEAPAHTSLSHLEGLVRAAHVRHFAPDVAAVAQGHISNTPLAEEPWLRLLSGMRHPAPRTKIAVAAPRVHHVAQVETPREVAIQGVIDAIGEAVRWDSKGLRKRSSEGAKDGQGVRTYFSKATIALRAAEGNLEQIYLQAGHPGGHRNSFTYGLLCYARDLLELGGLKVRTLAPSTINNYVSILRNHLTELRFSDLAAIGTEKRADAYRADIHRQLNMDRKIHRTAFEGFERSLLRHMDLIDEVDWATIPGRARSRHLPNVDANLIDPKLYQHVFEALKTLAREHPIAEIARALLLILYRFGLRTGEAAEVTAGGVMLHADGRISIRVAQSALTSRKSGNALRLVGPITLPPDELEFLTQYREERTTEGARRSRDLAKIQLLAAGGAGTLEHVESAQRLLIEMFRAASGDPYLRARHLRHTFVSRAFLTGRDPLDYLEPVSPAARSDAWWRTFAAGHASPDTSIVSYTHVVELAHYHYACRMVSEEVPLSFLSRLAGNDARSLERARHRKPDAVSATHLFRESLQRKFPCADVPDALAHRTDYPHITLMHTLEPVSGDAPRLSWNCAWEIYAAARIGRITGEVSDHAHSIRNRVRTLELEGRLMRRLKRRPQLGPEEEAAAAVLWPSLAGDQDLQRLVSSAAQWLRPRGGQLLLPVGIARQLKERLQHCGLVRLESHAGNSQRHWLMNPDTNGKLSTTWIELVAFLYSAMN